MVNELPWLDQIHPLARVKGRDATATELLAAAADTLPVQVRPLPEGASALEDYAQIDSALAVARPARHADDLFVDAPPLRLGYAGYAPQQRYRFLRWLRHPLDDAPAAFRQLWLAHLECALFDAPRRHEAQHLLHDLAGLAHWRSEPLHRSLLLAHWLAQDAPALAAWLAREDALPTPLFDLGLGHLALLQHPLDAALLGAATQRWLPEAADGKAAASTLRLASLLSAVEGEPLAWALRQSAAASTQAAQGEAEPSAASAADLSPQPSPHSFLQHSFLQPWRCAHRDLRLHLPQPVLRPALEAALRDVLSIHNSSDATNDHLTQENPVDEEWLLVLEFGQSRSDYFDYALAQARKRPGFAQLMDEKRQLVYRVAYRKRELRHFWRLWEYAQNWSSTHVYLNGRELSKWQVWRYSPHMR